MVTHNGIVLSDYVLDIPIAFLDTYEEDSNFIESNIDGELIESPYTPSLETHDACLSGYKVIAQVHALPTYLDLGEITEPTEINVLLWNGSNASATLTGFSISGNQNTQFTPPTTPLLITPETSYSFPLVVEQEGEENQDILLTFTFASGQVSTVQIVGFRIIVEPPPPLPEVPAVPFFFYVQAGRPTTKILSVDDLPLNLRSKLPFSAESDVIFESVVLEVLDRSVVEGEMYYNTTAHRYRFWNGTEWLDL